MPNPPLFFINTIFIICYKSEFEQVVFDLLKHIYGKDKSL
jgi:hypothetical protein